MTISTLDLVCNEAISKTLDRSYDVCEDLMRFFVEIADKIACKNLIWHKAELNGIYV